MKKIRLWSGNAPGALGDTDADIPTLTLYNPPAEKRNGAVVVVCPGGGYGGLAAHENEPIALWLNTLGVTSAVLKYRLGPRYQHPRMLEDAARAIRTVRANAKEWDVDPKRIGIIGFSAGGHLASTIATHFDAGNLQAADPVDRVSSRPDWNILVYPVITLTDPHTHPGSRKNLLGSEFTAERIELLSNERQVTPKTPPTFLVHTLDDAAVPCENSLLFAMACRKAGVPVELHLYETGPHGFGLGTGDPVLGDWPRACAAWMQKRGFFQSQSAR